MGVETVAVEDAFPAGEDGERRAAEEVSGEGAGVFAEGEHFGFGEASEVAALIIDAAGAVGKALAFRAVDEIETEDVFFSGGGDAVASAYAKASAFAMMLAIEAPVSFASFTSVRRSSFTTPPAFAS